ncbi:GerAB/ArcD/ProY family transporter [Paenibacillus sp. CF384]|uniref:GerAB/ArcD/ProY family transporter n=1 Tax=Paenibacillus sp. CF384 TaxID=1884382 RepID=UPI000894731D|nr:GerAB/ArcD/ProY family transporter [Paenibacillus sp. CF384]SDX50407.1 Spore germination protein [Paenibacillus sp. CF384]
MIYRLNAIVTIPLFVFVTHCSIIFLLFPKAMLRTTMHGHWEPSLLNMLIELILLLFLLRGISKAGEMDYADLFLPLGRFASSLLLLPLILYLLLIGIMGTRGFVELMQIVFVIRSPLYALLLFLCFITYVGSSIGPRGILRASTLLSLLYLPAIFFALLGCMKNSRLQNLFPIMNTSFDFMQQGKFLVPLFSICPFLLLGMLPPVIKVKIKPILLTMVPITIVYVAIVYVPILVYGVNAASLMNYPLVTSIDSVNITWTLFNRIAIFYAVALLAFVMLTTSFVLWSSAVLVRKMVPAWKESYIRPFLCLFIFVVAIWIPNWNTYVDIYTRDIWFRLFVFVVIPIAVYIRGGYVQRGGKKEGIR